MPVPFLGRLNIAEYAALVGSFLLVGLEAFIRVFTLALPPSLLELFYGISRRLFNRLTTPAQRRAQQRRSSISTSIRNASDFVDLCAAFGYTAEEHVVQTKDGYLLGLHRLAWRKGEEDMKVNRGPKGVKKRVVYLHHGLLMNSEVWVCLTDEQRCLPFVLVEKGFDVWFGNNRGNKYSKKSIRWSPTSPQFWNFSMDEFAFHDIPDSIGYILETTGQKSLSYIGFSQGTAQAFASLAVHPALNDQVDVFIALAPAMSPAGLSNGVVDALVKASPQVLFLLFGRRSILSSATMWGSILYPPLFTKLIDISLSFLFNWRTENISTSQKLAAYPHLYSFTSTKSVVHWFQIIRNKSFQMYDDDVLPPALLTTNRVKHTKVAKYPTRNIKTPIVLVYGGSDSLVDIKAMLRELPNQTLANEIPHYEHLDFLWARDVDKQVFQHVFDALESFTGAEHATEEYERYHVARQSSNLASSFTKKHIHRNSDVADSDVSTAVGVEDEAAEEKEQPPQQPRLSLSNRQPQQHHHHQYQHPSRESHIPSPSGGPSGIARPRGARGSHGEARESAAESPTSPLCAGRGPGPAARASRSGEPGPATAAGADGGAGQECEGPVSPSRAVPVRRRRGSGGSQISLESIRGGKGISLGASKAVGGVTKSDAEIPGMGGPGPGTVTGSPDQGKESQLRKTSGKK
ncbi:hypothetical protein VTK56DRAFT_2159 [Thermocarpiscus australiensis]